MSKILYRIRNFDWFPIESAMLGIAWIFMLGIIMLGIILIALYGILEHYAGR